MDVVYECRPNVYTLEWKESKLRLLPTTPLSSSSNTQSNGFSALHIINETDLIKEYIINHCILVMVMMEENTAKPRP